MPETLTILIASYLEPEYVERIRSINPRVRVLYEPSLIGKPRFIADHGAPVKRLAEEEAHWKSLLAEADILFDFDPTHRGDLLEVAPKLKWVQATSAGIGQFVANFGLSDRGVVFTTASGVHATALAEYCLMSMLMFAKMALHIAEEKQKKHWARFCAKELRGSTLAVVGLGRVGTEVARLGRCTGMRVIATKRTMEGVDPELVPVDALFPSERLEELLTQADYVVLSVPHTPETDQMMGERQIGLMKPGSVLINIARGAVIDEQVLIRALKSGHLRGASLDVFATEPLPSGSPLWEMPNVIICPHSASTADTENEKITEIFLDNLDRFINGKPMRNVLNTVRLY